MTKRASILVPSSQGVFMLIIDLDSTLLDARSLFEPINKSLVRRHGEDRVARAYDELADIGFSQREHLRLLGDPPNVAERIMRRYARILNGAEAHLYPGMLDLLARAVQSMPVVLLTAGHEETQRAKLDHLPSLRTHLSEMVVVKPGTKGDVVAKRTRFDAGHHWFVDDRASNLEAVARLASWVQRVRMDWSHTPCDGDGLRWSVARSSQDLQRLLGLP